MTAQKLAVTLLAPLAIGVMTLSQPARGQEPAGGNAMAGGAVGQPGGGKTIAVVGSATVKAIDSEKRLVTLETADGNERTIKVGKDAVNFDQVKVGDRVKALAMQRLLVSVAQGSGAEANDADSSGAMSITRAPKGAKPGLTLCKIQEVKVRIDDADALNRKVKFEAGGTMQSVEVAPDVDMSSLKPGDTVTLRVAQGVSLWIEHPDADAQPAAAEMKPGEAAEAIGGASATFTVSDIDKEKRIVTLKPAQGEPRQIQLGKEAINFDQIEVGDKVTATLAEETAVAISKGSSAPAAPDGMIMARAPQGSKPRVLISESEQVSGKIDSIDAEKRTITLTDKDGKSDTMKVGPKVDLSDLKAGDDVTARVTSAMGIVVEKA